MGRSRVASLDSPICQQSRALPRPSERGARARCSERALHPRPGGGGLRGGVRALPRRAALRGRGQRHRRPHDRAAGARRGPGRRGGDAVLHLLRHRRGGARARRTAGVLRHRPRHLLRHARHRPGGAHPAHQGDRAGGPVRQRRADPGAARARGAGGGGRGAGRGRRARRNPRGRPRRHRHVLVLPLEEPALPGRRWRDRHGRRRTRRAGSDPALPRVEGQGHLHRRGLQLAARRAAGGGRCACCCRSWTGGPSAAGRRPPPTSASGWASTPCCRSRPRARSTRTTSTSCAPSASSRSAAATTARRCTGSRRWRPTSELPATEEAARTNFALPMGTDLSEDQVRQVVEACASGST